MQTVFVLEERNQDQTNELPVRAKVKKATLDSRHKTMQYSPFQQTQKSSPNKIINMTADDSIMRSSLGYIRLINLPTFEEAAKVFNSIKSVDYSELVDSWKNFVKISNLLQHSPEKAEKLLDENKSLLDIKLVRFFL